MRNFIKLFVALFLYVYSSTYFILQKNSKEPLRIIAHTLAYVVLWCHMTLKIPNKHHFVTIGLELK